MLLMEFSVLNDYIVATCVVLACATAVQAVLVFRGRRNLTMRG